MLYNRNIFHSMPNYVVILSMSAKKDRISMPAVII